MKIIQSRSQNLLNRIYENLISIVWLFIPAAASYFFVPNAFHHAIGSTLVILTFILLFTLWLTLFNTGKSQITEYSIEINDTEIIFIKYGERQQIKWENFNGFSIKGLFPLFIVLHNISGKEVRFSYHTFSKTQRTQLFDTLSRRKPH